MSEKKRTKEGYQAMHDWNPSWEPGRFPRWFEKAMKGKDITTPDACGFLARYGSPITLPSGLFDHWGTVGGKDDGALITQPYHVDPAAIVEVAIASGARVAISPNAPWHPKAWLIEFIRPGCFQRSKTDL